ncbi:MAG: hypothetical protein ACI84R_003826 [Candidatus Azotimanducaceae bacterium]|jgi:hypothetical protein
MAFVGFFTRYVSSRWLLDRFFGPLLIFISITAPLVALVNAPSFFSGLSLMFRKLFFIWSFFLPIIGSLYLGMLYAEYKMRDEEKGADI